MYTPDPEKPFDLFPLGLPVLFNFHWRGDVFSGGALFHTGGVDVWADPEQCRYSERSAALVLQAAGDAVCAVETDLWDRWADFCSPMASRERVTAGAVALALTPGLAVDPMTAGARAFLMGQALMSASLTLYRAQCQQRDWEDSEEGARLRRQQAADERAEADAYAYESWKERRHAAGLPVRTDE